MENLTFDGIKVCDWKKLELLVQNFVDAVDDTEEEKTRLKVIRYINKLHKKYGDKSSILATKADYVKRIPLQKKLLELAYEIAENNKDYKNLVLISSSLIDLYEEILDENGIRFWINKLSVNLKKYPDSVELENLNTWKELYK